MRALLERAIQLNLANLAAQRGLRELDDSEEVVRDPVRGAFRIQDLEIEHAVYVHLDVVAGDADLRGNIDGRFLERVPVTDRVNEREEDVKAGVEGSRVPLQPPHDVGALLGDYDRGLGNNNYDHEGPPQTRAP